MRDYTDAKAMAKSLRAGLKQQGVEISHAQSLELVARQFDLPDWNVMSAQITAQKASIAAGVSINPAIPIIRCFEEEKTREFYLDYLGFTVDWAHRFEADLPLYQQVSRSGCLLHLSEHHGDATPGGRSFVPTQGLRAFHEELRGKPYANLRPGLEEVPWGLQMTLTDPFGNRLTFCEQRAEATKP